MVNASPKVFTAAEAATRLSLTAQRVRELCRDGRLGTLKAGVWIISADELQRFAKIKRLPGQPGRKMQ